MNVIERERGNPTEGSMPLVRGRRDSKLGNENLTYNLMGFGSINSGPTHSGNSGTLRG
jgi:hypothetical protein